MNSFESDLKRAVLSFRFLLGAAVQLAILWTTGLDSQLYKMSVPLVCTFPYACGFLEEYKGGFVKLALVRGSLRGYIWGKFLACGIAGGGVEALAAWVYLLLKQDDKLTASFGLLFLCGALWASVAAILAALSNSKYLAYGGSFVLYYFLVILCERYWKAAYCLYPYEWFQPRHVWLFDETGIVLMLSGFILMLGLWHFTILQRRIERA